MVQKSKNIIDKLWLWLLLAVIGEMVDVDDQICGIVVNLKKGQDKLSIWIRDAENKETIAKIGYFSLIIST